MRIFHSSEKNRSIFPFAGIFLLLFTVFRADATTFQVTNAADTGVGTLRAALGSSQSNAGSHIVSFNLAPPYLITVTSALPTLTNTVLIDGTTQPSFSNTPLVQLVGGTNFFNGVLHFFCTGGGVQALRIAGYKFDTGVILDGLSNRVQGCWLMSNGVGVIVSTFGGRALIGGTASSNRNVISANLNSAIQLVGPIGGTVVQGNYIGTDPSGLISVSNFVYGMNISCPSNVIGGSTVGERNIIGGSGQYEMILSAGSDGTQVSGNFIGTDVTGTNSLHGGTGMSLQNARFVTVGGPGPAYGNYIAGNNGVGINIFGTNAGFNAIQNNRVGVGTNGLALSNGTTFNLAGGIYVGSDSNSLFFNVVSGNVGNGIRIVSRGNTLGGNIIGLDPTGTFAVTNSQSGIELNSGATANIIGTFLFRNIISANGIAGIRLTGGASSNVIANNFVGTDTTGMLPVGNATDGIFISGADGTVIGTAATGGNLISGNAANGINLQFSGAHNTRIDFNQIGTDATGTNAMGNTQSGISLLGSSGHRVGTGGRNVICANGLFGIVILGDMTNVVVASNYVGIATNGVKALGNAYGIGLSQTSGNGVWITNNVVSGNTLHGMAVSQSTASNVVLAGNIIGLSPTGVGVVSNGGSGINMDRSINVRVGGSNVQERNLISGSGGRGIFITSSGSNGPIVIAGNYIGLDSSGAVASNTSYGINGQNSHNIQVGGPSPSWRNVIGGNEYGIFSEQFGTNWWIANNYIGVDPSGLVTRSNHFYGIFLSGTIISNIVENNIIAGNGADGLYFQGGISSSVVRANRIGMGALPFAPLPNNGAGIRAYTSSHSLIGGLTTNDANRIAYNNGPGIIVFNSVPSDPHEGIRMLGNLIYSNASLGIDLNLDGVTANDPAPDADNGLANNLQNFPDLLFASYNGTNISGRMVGSNTTYRLEFFALTPSAGMMFIGATNHFNPSTGTGTFSFAFNVAVPTNSLIVATATSGDGTSEFSPTLSMSGLADSDGDKMPDWWEIANSLNAGVSNGPSDDADSDGVFDINEWIADTLPQDSASFPRIVGESNGTPWLVFVPSSGTRLYGLESAVSPTSQTWSVIQSNVPGSGALLGLQDPATATQRMYRATVKLP